MPSLIIKLCRTTEPLHTFVPGNLFRLRIPVSGETFEPDNFIGLRISVSGETFA